MPLLEHRLGGLPLSIRPGTGLGRYEIRSKIGEGGMGEVYLAQDTKLERTVALKILPANVAADRQRMQRFIQEAKAASGLNHPNILTIHEIEQIDSRHFIATEFIDGETLRQHLNAGRVKIAEALDISVQIASALSAAHAAGIIHRDIKPENIMRRRDGIVKVLDFGLAKLSERTGTGAVDTEAATKALVQTEPGVVMGTAAYMSPEQARGIDTDARTDIFSLGVVLYEMLAGRAPFAGETTADIISVLLQKEPQPLSTLAPEVPAELQHIVSKALRKDRDERYQTVKSLLVDLKTLQKELDFAAKLERGTAPPELKGSGGEIKSGDGRAAVSTASGAASPITNEGSRASLNAGHIVSEIRQHKRGFIVALSVLILAVVSLSYWFYVKRSRTVNSTAIESIAVLPFVNASQDPNADYLSDGIAESLMNSLSQLPNLKVMSRNTTFRYKGKEQEAQKVGRELNVRAVLTGKVQQVGDQVVINVSLDDAVDSHHIWGEQYVRKFADILTVQREIAKEVSTSLRLKLTLVDEQHLAKRSTDNVEAYQLYLKGQYEWKKHTEEDLRKSVEYYYQALTKDPNYALAYAGLAASYTVLGNSYLPPNETFPKAKAYATKALEIDETLAEAHVVMGAARLLYDWNWAEAERELKRAQALDPNNAEAHNLYGYYLKAMGRLDEANVETRRSQELDPLSLMINTDVGVNSYYARRYDEAIAQNEKTVNLDPRFFIAYLWLGQAYEQKKMYAEAIATFQKGMNEAERHPQLLASLGRAYALAGQPDKAQKALDELREMSKSRYVSPYLIAVVYAGLGDKDQAFAWLEQAYQDRSFFLIWLKVEPRFDSLRDDPRFQDLLRRVGFPQ
ncbi:MAG: protein kinase [Acidobacteriota bacterium]|nr:protein kinase [Acidobacteriota bacterium]